MCVEEGGAVVVNQNSGLLLFGVRFVYLPDSILSPSPKPENRLARNVKRKDLFYTPDDLLPLLLYSLL